MLASALLLSTARLAAEVSPASKALLDVVGSVSL